MDLNRYFYKEGMHGQQVHKDMLNLISHSTNSNQSCKIPPYSPNCLYIYIFKVTSFGDFVETESSCIAGRNVKSYINVETE